MNANVMHPQSERGVALIMALLMLAVLSGLATGFAMTGQTEVAMAENELYYAGSRSAAEAGLNRATERIVNDTARDLLAGLDGLVSATLDDAVNADNGSIADWLGGAGPYALDAAGNYTYNVEILDDDDPRLYAAPLTGAQLAAMGENNDRFVNANDRLILRATGFGPKGTTIRIMRELFSQDAVTPASTQTLLANPAILVDGDLDIGGSIRVLGSEGNIHANGNLLVEGNAAQATGDVTATGTYTANDNWEPGGSFGGGRDAITVPEILASNYESLTDIRLHSNGTCTPSPCPSEWTHDGATNTWELAGNTASAGTLYVEGHVLISGSPGKKGSEVALSVISEGTISITGTPKLKPENGDKIQFVCNGDLIIAGNTDIDDPTNVDGQIMVREQIFIPGNPEFQGRIMVANEESQFDHVTVNSIPGNPTITYNGTLGDIVTEIVTAASTSYVNNVRGWMEQ